MRLKPHRQKGNLTAKNLHGNLWISGKLSSISDCQHINSTGEGYIINYKHGSLLFSILDSNFLMFYSPKLRNS